MSATVQIHQVGDHWQITFAPATREAIGLPEGAFVVGEIHAGSMTLRIATPAQRPRPPFSEIRPQMAERPPHGDLPDIDLLDEELPR